MNKDLCQDKNCSNYLKYSRYCHHVGFTIKPETVIKKESDKRKEVNRKEYGPKSRKFVKDNPNCQAAISGLCDGKSKCVHHKKGKNSKDDLLDEKYWLAVCFSCHRCIEDNPLFAKEQGFSVSRHSKTTVK